MKSNLKSALLAASFCLPFCGGAAYADPIAIGATFPASITVPEDGGTHVINYTLTNNSTTDTITINDFQAGRIPFLNPFRIVDGDTSDGINIPDLFLAISFGTCSGSIAPGGTCMASFSFTVDDGTGETDANTGASKIFVRFLDEQLSGFVAATVSLETTITVTDVGVPGPIAGAGLPGLLLASVGLLGWWRRRQKIA